MKTKLKINALGISKICFVLPKFAPENIGGAELQVYYLAKELIDRGFKVSYIRHDGTHNLSNKNFEGISLYSIPNIRFFFMQYFNAFHLLRKIKEVNADLYYCRVSKSYLPITVWGASKQKALSAWACSHDREVEKFKPRTNNIIKKTFEYFEHWIFNWGLKNVNYRFLQSEKQLKLLNETYSFTGKVLENSHPLPLFKSNIREKIIVWIANFREFKQPELFVELAKKLSDKKYKFLMVGEIFETDTKSNFEQLSNDLENFQYIGSLPIKNVNDLLWNCRLLVNTSSQEGFPNTYIQALMRGVPIISLNVDPGNIIANYALGVINNDLNIVTDKIDELMKNDSLWSKTSNRCRKFAEDRFNIAKYTDIFLSEIDLN